jgi:hypothetical protein
MEHNCAGLLLINALNVQAVLSMAVAKPERSWLGFQ